MNAKAKGEKAQNIVIGELAKLDIQVAIPLTDNLPWDFILIYKNKLYKVQVKSSDSILDSGAIAFDLRSNNWHAKTIKKYNCDDCDMMILYHFETGYCYLLGPDEFSDRSSFAIRKTSAVNGQVKKINMHNDYILSLDSLDKVCQ